MTQLMPGFGGGSVATPAAPAPVPTREDPAVTQAKTDLKLSELKRRGRAASILTSGSGADKELGAGTTLDRPQARSGAALLGG